MIHVLTNSISRKNNRIVLRSTARDRFPRVIQSTFEIYLVADMDNAIQVVDFYVKIIKLDGIHCQLLNQRKVEEGNHLRESRDLRRLINLRDLAQDPTKITLSSHNDRHSNGSQSTWDNGPIRFTKRL